MFFDIFFAHATTATALVVRNHQRVACKSPQTYHVVEVASSRRTEELRGQTDRRTDRQTFHSALASRQQSALRSAHARPVRVVSRRLRPRPSAARLLVFPI